MALRNAFENLATDTKLETVRVLLDAITAAQATEATLAALNVKVPALIGGRLPVDAALDVSALATQATLAQLEAKLPAGLTAANGALSVAPRRPDSVVTGVLAAAGSELAAAVDPGMRAVSFSFTGVFAGLNLAPEVSFDGGTNWLGLPSVRSTAPTFGVITSSINVGASPGIIDAVIPAGATHVRLRAVAISSGSANTTLAQSAQPFAPPWTIANLPSAVALASSGTTLGNVYRRGVWQDDSSTALAASGTFTGASRNVTQASAGASNFGTATAGVDRSRFLAVSDVAGTLAIEVSRDGVTWRRIWEEPTSNSGTGGLHVAEVEIKPATASVRAVYINGAAAQTHFMLQSIFLS